MKSFIAVMVILLLLEAGEYMFRSTNRIITKETSIPALNFGIIFSLGICIWGFYLLINK